MKRASGRKRRAIADLDKMKVEVRALDQQSKKLEAELNAEREIRSAERTKAEVDLKAVQDTLTASRAALRKYKEGEPSRLAAARQEYLHSERFGLKFGGNVSSTFAEAVKVTVTYLKKGGHLPEGMHIPASDLAAMIDDIPDAFFSFEDPE